jgi:hypothetical protein
MLTKCPSCNRQIPADSRRCPYCEKKLNPPPSLDDQPPRNRESLLLACWEMLRGKRPVSCAGIAIATSFFLFSLACLLCVLVWGFAPKVSTKPASRFPGIATRTPCPTIEEIAAIAEPSEVPEPTTEPEPPGAVAPTARIMPTEAPEPTAVPEPSLSPSPTPERTILETDDGLIEIPGPAYMDGRDLEAADPVTVMTINIWDTPQRSEVVCTIEHGTPVDVLRIEEGEAEGRYYLKVKSGACEGWVSESFVSSKYHEPEGELLQ